MSEYISAKDTAKLVRAALKKNFPEIKFSVRLGASRSSINVRWTDGPVIPDVEKVIDNYEGARFDGMYDLEYGAEHYLTEDGTAHLKRTYGHSFDTDEVRDAPSEPHRNVSFGAKYIFADRDYSMEFFKMLVEKTAKYWGVDPVPEVITSPYSDEPLLKDGQLWIENAREWFSTLVYRMSRET